MLFNLFKPLSLPQPNIYFSTHAHHSSLNRPRYFIPKAPCRRQRPHRWIPVGSEAAPGECKRSFQQGPLDFSPILQSPPLLAFAMHLSGLAGRPKKRGLPPDTPRAFPPGTKLRFLRAPLPSSLSLLRPLSSSSPPPAPFPHYAGPAWQRAREERSAPAPPTPLLTCRWQPKR